VRKAKYDLDEAEVKPYFELNNVLENGVFYAANQLYGITFKERRTSRSTSRTSVSSKSQRPTASRWLFSIATTSSATTRTVAPGWASRGSVKASGHSAGGLQRREPSEARPRRAGAHQLTDVTTMFHEFGHALHGMFANTMYPSLSGAAVPRDFVEFPSQIDGMGSAVFRLCSINGTRDRARSIVVKETRRSLAGLRPPTGSDTWCSRTCHAVHDQTRGTSW